MHDRREEIFKAEYGKLIATPDKLFVQHPHAIKATYNAMDEYMRECVLEFIDYVAKNKIEIKLVKGEVYGFRPDGEGVTKQHLFEDFL